MLLCIAGNPLIDLVQLNLEWKFASNKVEDLQEQKNSIATQETITERTTWITWGWFIVDLDSFTRTSTEASLGT